MILKPNLNKKDKIFSVFVALDIFLKINSIRVLLRFKKSYKNYLQIFKEEKKNNYPINCILKNNQNFLLYHKKDISLLTHNEMWKICKFVKDFLYIKINEQTLIFYNSHLGDMVAVFANEQYKKIAKKDKILIDIGAAIGDSSIYAAFRGCKKVIAIEPLKINFEIMKKNIDINNMVDRIIPINAALTHKSSITIDNTLSGPGNRLLSNHTTNQEIIPGISLEKLIENSEYYEFNKNDSLILKIDCEGCEYDAILNTPDHILKKFELISLEYHFGYQSIKEKLQSLGFEVYHTNPRHVFRGDGSYYGYLHAENKNISN
tara:strand:- start:1994 stop:2947 length:954 start_codon:yes stop_codon:yes gene_type:complete